MSCLGMALVLVLAQAAAPTAACTEGNATQQAPAPSEASGTFAVLAYFSEGFLGMMLELGCFCVAFASLRYGFPKFRRSASAAKAATDVAVRSKGSAFGHDASPKTARVLTAADLLRCAREGAPCLPVELEGSLTSEALAQMVVECERLGSHSEIIEAAAWLHRLSMDRRVHIFSSTFERLLAIYALGDEARGRDCLHRLLSRRRVLNAGICKLVMVRCVASKCLGLALGVAAHLSQRQDLGLPVFKALLSVYAAAGMHNEACGIYNRMLEAGVEPDAGAYGKLMRCAQAVGNELLSQELAIKSEGCGCIKTILKAIRSAGKEGQLEKAIEAFRQVDLGRALGVSTLAYNIVIDACCANKDVVRALELFEEMGQKGVKKNHITFNTMIKGYGAVGQAGQLHAMMGDMKRSGFEPDRATYSCLLGCHAKASEFEQMWKVLAEIDRLGFGLDSHIVAIVMRSSRHLPTTQEVEKALSILDRPGVDPCADVLVLCAALEACICAKDRQRLDRVMSGYMNRRSSLTGSACLYCLLVQACGVLGRLSMARQVWGIMLQEFDAPTEVGLGCMVDALVEGRQAEEALALFQEWRGRVACGTITYSALIKGFAHVSDADRAMEIFREMRCHGVPRNAIVYTSLLTAHVRAGFMDRVDGILSEMREDGCSPNAITFSVIIRGHCLAGNMSTAVEAMQRMAEVGLQPDCVIYNTVISGCVRQSNYDLADMLIADMKQKGVAPSNITISIVLRMWSRRGCLDKAIETVYDALEGYSNWEQEGKGHSPPIVDAQVGSELIGACIHHGKPKLALEIFRDFKRWPNFDGPDGHAYNAIICGLVKSGDVREAARIAEESLEVLRGGFGKKTVDPNTMFQLFRALRNADLIEKIGFPLYDKLVSVGFPVEARWITLRYC
mmetsp:Transcript_98474/g.284173  ORF Transcript_98474/g.284173 Transcript_98474/m.284173 type:complete len:903 (+) Transcript_98474:28-2736(+)